MTPEVSGEGLCAPQYHTGSLTLITTAPSLPPLLPQGCHEENPQPTCTQAHPLLFTWEAQGQQEEVLHTQLVLSGMGCPRHMPPLRFTPIPPPLWQLAHPSQEGFLGEGDSYSCCCSGSLMMRAGGEDGGKERSWGGLAGAGTLPQSAV